MDTPFSAQRCGDRLLVSLAGEIDLTWREEHGHELREALESEPALDIVIDMGDVTFADSCALSLFAQLYKQYKDSDRQLYFAHVPPIVVTAMETVGLTRYLNVLANGAEDPHLTPPPGDPSRPDSGAIPAISR